MLGSNAEHMHIVMPEYSGLLEGNKFSTFCRRGEMCMGVSGEGCFGVLGGGTNLCDEGLDLSGSWQQGHSATYNAPSRI